MAIEKIDQDICIGCGKCEIYCPADVIRMNTESRKAYIKYPEDCAMCLWCMAECSQNAISVSYENTSPYFTSWG